MTRFKQRQAVTPKLTPLEAERTMGGLCLSLDLYDEGRLELNTKELKATKRALAKLGAAIVHAGGAKVLR